MDAKNDLNKLWKDLQSSAREFASYGLQVSSKYLEATAGALTSLKEGFSKTAEKLAPEKSQNGQSDEQAK